MKKYTRKQITEALAYWKNVLEQMDSSATANQMTVREFLNTTRGKEQYTLASYDGMYNFDVDGFSYDPERNTIQLFGGYFYDNPNPNSRSLEDYSAFAEEFDPIYYATPIDINDDIDILDSGLKIQDIEENIPQEYLDCPMEFIFEYGDYSPISKNSIRTSNNGSHCTVVIQYN